MVLRGIIPCPLPGQGPDNQWLQSLPANKFRRLDPPPAFSPSRRYPGSAPSVKCPSTASNTGELSVAARDGIIPFKLGIVRHR